MDLKLTILGCGPSSGVPSLMVTESGEVKENWGDCNPQNPKNRRTRMSCLLEYAGCRVLLDTSPDLREQLLRSKPSGNIDAVLFTHDHADHCHGIDDLRPLYFSLQKEKRKPYDIFGDKKTIEGLKSSFPYLFSDHMHYSERPGLYPELMKAHIIDPYKNFKLFGLKITPIEQDHGYTTSIGYRIGNDLAYSTDVKELDNRALNALSGIKYWLVDCLCYNPTPTHAYLEKTLQWINIIKPEKAILIHMKNTMDYDDLIKILPKNVTPAYDGMKLEFKIK